MLKRIEIKPMPEISDLVEAFGHAADPQVKLRHITITLPTRGFEGENVRETLTAYRDFIRNNSQEILDTFNKAGVICCSGLPMQSIGKVYPDISVWVREQDLGRAGAAFLAAPWAVSIKKDNLYSIGDSMRHGPV